MLTSDMLAFRICLWCPSESTCAKYLGYLSKILKTKAPSVNEKMHLLRLLHSPFWHHQTPLACLQCTWGWQRTQMMRAGMKRIEEEAGTMAVSAARELASDDWAEDGCCWRLSAVHSTVHSTVQYSCQRDAHRPGATIPHWYTDQPPYYTSVLYIWRVGNWCKILEKCSRLDGCWTGWYLYVSCPLFGSFFNMSSHRNESYMSVQQQTWGPKDVWIINCRNLDTNIATDNPTRQDI